MKRCWMSAGPGLALALSLSSTLAFAAPSATEKAAAEALFEEGTALIEKGELASGCEKLAASQEVDPTIGTLLRLGDCYDRLKKTASAWASFKQAAALARANSQADREAIARERVTDLETRLSRLKLVVADTSPDLRITLGGVAIPRASWGTALPVDPGVQRVEASANGRIAWSAEVEIQPGPASSDIEVPKLLPTPEAASESPRSSVSVGPARESSHSGSGQRVFGYVVGGVGMAALTAGGVFAYLAYDKNQDSLDQCLREDPNVCSIEGKELRDDAAGFATIANIGVGAGAGLLLTGVVLLLTAPSTGGTREASRPLSFSAGINPGSLKLDLKGAF